MSRLRMLTEFLRLSTSKNEDPVVIYEETEDEGKPLYEAPLRFLKRIFGRGKKDKKGKSGGVPNTPDTASTPASRSKTQQKKLDKDPSKKRTYKPGEKWISAGCVVFDSPSMDKVYVIQQKNWNTWAFPKGQVDKGESFKKAAKREVAEETGLVVAILPSGFLGKGKGSMSITYFFAAMKTGGSIGQHDQEVAKVKLVSFTEAYKLFKRSGGTAGRRDIAILRKAWEYANQHRKNQGLKVDVSPF